MPWLDRLDNRRTRRLAHDLQHQALATRDLTKDQLQQFGRQAGAIAGQAAHQLADYGRHEGEILAHAAAVQAARAGRAVKADPVPAIVGAIGIALLASLIFGRRRA